jgi:tetratricopeptide (TPR) repeat protein
MVETGDMLTAPNVKNLENLGWQQLSDNNYDGALKTFSKVLELEYPNEAGFQGKAAALRKKGLFTIADQVVQEGLQHFDESKGLLSEIAWLNLETKNNDKAIEAFEKIISIDSIDIDPYLWKIYLLRSMKRFTEAATTLKQAETIFPDRRRLTNEWGWLYFHQELFDEAIEAFNRTLQLDPNNVTAYQGLIASLRKKGLFEQAETLIGDADKSISDSIPILNEMGWAFFERGLYNDAERVFDQVLRKTPGDPYAYINKAWVFLKRWQSSDIDEAKQCCREARKLAPELPQAFSILGVIAFREGKIRESEAYLKKAIDVDPDNGPYSDLAALYIQLEQLDAAETLLEKAGKMFPNDTYGHIQLGSLYLLQGKNHHAILEFRKAAVLAPYDVEPQKALAIALIENKQFGEAERVLRNAIRSITSPKIWELRLTLSQLFTRIGDDTSDKEYFQKAISEIAQYSRSSNDPLIDFQMGILRYKLGNYKSALSSFKKCVESRKGWVEAEINANRIESLIRQEKAFARTSLPERIFIAGIIIVNIIGIWYLYLFTERISETSVMVIIPLLLGFLLVSFLLPWLTKFKLTGFEAELSEPTPKDSLSIGPKGEIITVSTPPEH